ncbi:MAG TPA: hypothetical protein VF581_07760 [Flavobacterium sp.]|jgi:hypothetical protein
MKFKKPSNSALTDHASMIGGGIVGGLVSNGIFGLVSKPTASVDPAAVKKAENKALIIRAVIAVAAGYAGSAIDGKDSGATLAKGALVGVAIAQTAEIAKHFAAKTPAITTAANGGTKSARFLADSLGLACACNEGLGRPRNNRNQKRRHLGMADMSGFIPGVIEMNPLELAVQGGSYAS